MFEIYANFFPSLASIVHFNTHYIQYNRVNDLFLIILQTPALYITAKTREKRILNKATLLLYVMTQKTIIIIMYIHAEVNNVKIFIEMRIIFLF